MKQLVIAFAVIASLTSCSDTVKVRTFQGQPMKVNNGFDLALNPGDTILIKQSGIGEWFIPNDPNYYEIKSDTTIAVTRMDTIIGFMSYRKVIVTKQ